MVGDGDVVGDGYVVGVGYEDGDGDVVGAGYGDGYVIGVGDGGVGLGCEHQPPSGSGIKQRGVASRQAGLGRQAGVGD